MHLDGAQALHAALQVTMKKHVELHVPSADVELILLVCREAILKRSPDSQTFAVQMSKLSGIWNQGQGSKQWERRPLSAWLRFMGPSKYFDIKI